MIKDRTATLLAASVWVFGPVLLKILSEAGSTPARAFVASSAVLLVSLLHIAFASTGPLQVRRDFMHFAWGMVMFGAVPALVVIGIVTTDIVSVALISGLSIFVFPGMAWLMRRRPLDGGFLILFVLVVAGGFPIVYGRARLDEATAFGDLLMVCGIVFLAFGFMRQPLRALKKQQSLREVSPQIAGAALVFAALSGAYALAQFRIIEVNGFPLLSMLAVSLLAYGCSRYWSRHAFDWQAWPVRSLAAFLPIAVVLGWVSFDVSIDGGEIITVGLLTVIVASAHWMRRWLAH